MTSPRLEIDLDKIFHNAHSLVERLAMRGISVTGVTKASLGRPDIANTLIRAGIESLGDARIENIETMRRARISASMILIRSPMLSMVDRVVRHADVSLNTELAVIRALSLAARDAGVSHGVVLMIELGDLREGLMPADLAGTVREVLRLPNIKLRGIGTNLACQSGVSPDARNMAELSALAQSIEAAFGLELDIVSGGNSANLDWALGDATMGRVNHLRLGESILLGCEPLHRQPIEDLHTDAFTFVAEVIELKLKPSQARGRIAQTAFGEKQTGPNRGNIRQAILATGRQDVDPDGLIAPAGITLLGASSDHLMIDAGDCHLSVGEEIRFGLNYSALVRAMTSPFVMKAAKPAALFRKRCYRGNEVGERS